MKNFFALIFAAFGIAAIGAVWAVLFSWSISTLFKIDFGFLRGLGLIGVIFSIRLVHMFWEGKFNFKR